MKIAVLVSVGRHPVSGTARHSRNDAAALDIAYVAAGRLDGFWERNLSPWDIAAGQILIREAGGTISGLEGKDDAVTSGHVICGNEYVHGELLKILKAASK